MISGCNLCMDSGATTALRGCRGQLGGGRPWNQKRKNHFFPEENKRLELARRRKMTKSRRREQRFGLGDEGLGFDGLMGILKETMTEMRRENIK